MRGWLVALDQGLGRGDRSVIYGVLRDAVTVLADRAKPMRELIMRETGCIGGKADYEIAASAGELTEAVEARDLPEKLFYWSPPAVRAWLARTMDPARESLRACWKEVAARAQQLAEPFVDCLPVISLGAGDGSIRSSFARRSVTRGKAVICGGASGGATSGNPPLKGKGRTAEGSSGWGGGGDGRRAAEALSPPPGPLTRADLPPPGEGEVVSVAGPASP